MLLVFEGIDGSGKSLQLSLLAGALSVDKISVLCVDGDTPRPSRRLYRELISSAREFPSPLMSLFLGLSDPAYLVSKYRQAIASKDTLVIFHRYIYSTVADAIALGIPAKGLAPIIRLFPVPDLTVLLETHPEVAIARKDSVSLAEAGGPDFLSRHKSLRTSFVDFQERVYNAFQAQIRWQWVAGPVLQIPGTLHPQDIHQTIVKKVRVLLFS